MQQVGNAAARLLRFLNENNSDIDVHHEFSLMPSTNNHRKKAIKQVEEEPKVLRDANLTVRNKIPQAKEDSEGSDSNQTN